MIHLVRDTTDGLLGGVSLLILSAVWPTWRGTRSPRPRSSLEDRLTQWGATVIVLGALTAAIGC